MRAGGTLTLNNSTLSGTYSATGGAAGTGATAGSAQGQTLYLQGGTAATVLSGTQTLAGADAVAGAGGLTKSGSGTLTLNGANANYTGATTVAGGVINFNAANNFGTANHPQRRRPPMGGRDDDRHLHTAITLATGGGTFDTNGNNVAFASFLTGGGGLTKAGTGTLTLSVANSYLAGRRECRQLADFGGRHARQYRQCDDDQRRHAQSRRHDADAERRSHADGRHAAERDAVVVGVFDMQSGTVSAVLTGRRLAAEDDSGHGDAFGRQYLHRRHHDHDGTLALSGFGDVSSSSSVTVGNGATFDVSASGFFFVPIATLAGSGTVQLGGNGLVIVNGSTEFSGAINGSGGLEIFSGTQTLSGINSYTNVTQIDRGATLALKGAGSIASSAVVTSPRSDPGWPRSTSRRPVRAPRSAACSTIAGSGASAWAARRSPSPTARRSQASSRTAALPAAPAAA